MSDGIPEYVNDLPLLDVRKVARERDVYDEARDAAVGMQSTFGESAAEARYDAQHGVQSKHWLTILRPEDAAWIIGRLGERIVGKTVVEIGAGIGVLAIEMAKVAKRVFAIESDPKWGVVFARYMYREKPSNLTWILDRAENVVDLVHADIAVVVTGSDEVALRALAGRFAQDVAMPWQDWNGGRAVVKGWLTHVGDVHV
jgi:hypothetical protein